MYKLQIKVDGNWITHDEFDSLESAKIAQSYLEHDYKHLENRIVKDSFYVLTREDDFTIEFYAGVDPVDLEPIFKYDFDSAFKFSTRDEALRCRKNYKNLYQNKEDELFVVNIIEP